MKNICQDPDNGLDFLDDDEAEADSSDDDQCCAKKTSPTVVLKAEEKKKKSEEVVKSVAKDAFPQKPPTDGTAGWTINKLENAETGGDCYVMWRESDEKLILAFRGTEAAKEKNKLTSDTKTRTVK